MLTTLATSCKSSDGFSAEEKQIIHSGGKEDMMRLLTIDNQADSMRLRTVSEDVSDEMMRSDDFRLLVERMHTTVLDPKNTGVGIAAPQVGILRKIVMLQRFDLPGEPFKILVNPEIVSLSDERKPGPEGCLSVPGYRADVPRATDVVVRYTDGETFEKREEKISGFTAVIVQHETDHLHGRLYIDRVSPDALIKASRDEVNKSYEAAR